MYFAATACSSTENAVDDAAANEARATEAVAASDAPGATTNVFPAVSTSVETTTPSTISSVPVAEAAPTTSPSGRGVASPNTTNSSMITTTSATSARPQLVVSATSQLDPNGSTVTVRGAGFDVTKGIYVAVCNQPQVIGRRCVGGVNIDGSSAQSIWISSNPPGYAAGLPLPYGDNGVFSVTLLAKATSPNIDCTRESCGIVAFADHTRSDDRTQDVFIPVTFG
jgi:hypothetical protein